MKVGKLVNRLKKALLILLIIVFSLSCCGCWNYREINNISIVAGFAIDKNTVTNKYIVTAEIVNPQTSKEAMANSSAIYSSEGVTIFDAVRQLITVIGQRLFWSDAKVMIISEDVARDGVEPVIDWVNRDSEPRSDIFILIARENSAAEILSTKVANNKITSFYLNDMMKSYDIHYKFPHSTLWEFLNDFVSEGKTNSAATVTVKSNDSNKTLTILGSAIFKKDKYIGWLNENETNSFLMINGKMKKGLIVLKNIENSGVNLTLEIMDNTENINTKFENGKLTMVIDIIPEVTIDEITGQLNYMDEKQLEKIKMEADWKVQSQIENIIMKMQKEYQCDIFGFGKIIERQNPKAWKLLKNDRQTVFCNLRCIVNVDVKILGSSHNSKPIKIGD